MPASAECRVQLLPGWVFCVQFGPWTLSSSCVEERHGSDRVVRYITTSRMEFTTKTSTRCSWTATKNVTRLSWSFKAQLGLQQTEVMIKTKKNTKKDYLGATRKFTTHLVAPGNLSSWFESVPVFAKRQFGQPKTRAGGSVRFWCSTRPSTS